jgi:hypothetical protein
MRSLISQLLYGAGVIAYRIDWGTGYQRFMEWSFRVQGTGPGPWAPTLDK